MSPPHHLLCKAVLTCVFSTLNLQKAYAAEITDRLTSLGLHADVDNGENTLPKKIRNGEIAQYNFILGMCLMFYSFLVISVSDSN